MSLLIKVWPICAIYSGGGAQRLPPPIHIRVNIYFHENFQVYSFRNDYIIDIGSQGSHQVYLFIWWNLYKPSKVVQLKKMDKMSLFMLDFLEVAMLLSIFFLYKMKHLKMNNIVLEFGYQLLTKIKTNFGGCWRTTIL